MHSCGLNIGMGPSPNKSPKLHSILILLGVVNANLISQTRNIKMCEKKTKSFPRKGRPTLHIPSSSANMDSEI